jgi:CheY-like chemotaxis protein
LAHFFYSPVAKAEPMTSGPIVIVEDDPDDQDVYKESIRTIGIPNEICFFGNGKTALDYISTTEDQPLIILSDINMPGMSGLELKKYIQEDPYLSAKGIPFVFISTNATKASVRHAHALSVQGYFEKPQNMQGFTKMLRVLFDYWELCKHINNT